MDGMQQVVVDYWVVFGLYLYGDVFVDDLCGQWVYFFQVIDMLCVYQYVIGQCMWLVVVGLVGVIEEGMNLWVVVYEYFVEVCGQCFVV